jgi:hypothetical protein
MNQCVYIFVKDLVAFVTAIYRKEFEFEFLCRGFLYFLKKRAVNRGCIRVFVNGIDKTGKQIIVLRFIYFTSVF